MARATYTRCKTKGHWWDDSPKPYKIFDGVKIWPACVKIEYSVCVGECKTVRMFQLASDGTVIDRKYKYPDDYKWSGPKDEKPTRAEMRLARLKNRRK